MTESAPATEPFGAFLGPVPMRTAAAAKREMYELELQCSPWCAVSTPNAASEAYQPA